MKSIGVVRKVDELGRIVLPIELRRTLNINIKDPIEIFVENDTVLLKKYIPSDSCVVCESIADTFKFRGKDICIDCFNEIKGIKI
ncbi:AbrB/MazE/SpoVT family DNA-binding domain-containing protein [Bacillus sp. PS06]|uniref:AbrB/MazE/SpoVT family DNA-binding domain-containing protein n=1 Tax=Bacillus sp. PS06 TaxID=2764176 RepID=UPI00177E1E38|nr:AbrB/MazE/SpoVT family DNA-binding domain-containing protein [Bacillus sp. PS06]MBD8069359.1 AbrB/MazE/SpoVT family DNA-binding domain-containing protein [Bacillus sp. PS06]